MAVLCFGGSFNPVHNGHLICARAVAEAKGFDHVLLIPNARSPLKPHDPDWVEPCHRLRMCELAVARDPLFTVDDIELNRPPPSYTIDTVRELKRTRGWKELSWLIGADMVEVLPRWHDPIALMCETNFVVMARPGWTFDWEKLPAEYRALRDHVVEAPLIEIGATEIRKRVREGKLVRYLTPDPVVDYIRENALFANSFPSPSGRG
jgi:nicotinate-nucleotide adenylyltransferase